MTGADDRSVEGQGIADLVSGLFLKYSVLIDAKESTWHRRTVQVILTVLRKDQPVVAVVWLLLKKSLNGPLLRLSPYSSFSF